jgi:serine/threonine-protein phosphatase 4 regulatory subunit 1
MGNAVSIVNIQHSNPTSDEAAVSEEAVSDAHPRSSVHPSHIHLTPPDASVAFAPPPIVSPCPADNPFDSPPLSPALSFYTAPSTPVTSPQGEDPPLDPLPPPVFGNSSPPSPPLTSHHTLASIEIETIPPPEALSSPDFALDFTLDDEGLSTLEKIYLFSRSRSAHHR